MVDKGDTLQSRSSGESGAAPARRRVRWALVLLLIPFVALLYPPFYASLTPRFLGIPFFIWYQFAWVILGVLITGIVYALDRGSEPSGNGRPNGGAP